MERLTAVCLLATGIALGAIRGAAQEEEVVATRDNAATLTLRAGSFVSFGDESTISIPEGSTITFRFGDPTGDGRVPFWIAPSDVRISELRTTDGRALRYSLAGATSGYLQATTAGVRLEFPAVIRATLVTSGKSASFDYAVRFTTERTSAGSADATRSISANGRPLDMATRSIVLVAAATSRTTAYPGPGRATYASLAGDFDRLPPDLAR